MIILHSTKIKSNKISLFGGPVVKSICDFHTLYASMLGLIRAVSGF